MSDSVREAFEAYYSSNGKYPAAIKCEPDGMYTLMQTSAAWVNFRDGYAAALATFKNDQAEAAYMRLDISMLKAQNTELLNDCISEGTGRQIYGMGYRSGVKEAADLCMAVPLDHLNDGDEIAETYKACAFSCAARIRAMVKP